MLRRFCLMMKVVLTALFFHSGTAMAEPPRFVDFNDGTILDTVSNLRWLKDANCFGAKYTSAAKSAASNLVSGQCGLIDGSVAGDWHLPTISELRIFTDAGYRYDSLNSGGFSNVQAGPYWSSSPGTWYVGDTYSVNMADGNVNGVDNRNDEYYVWPVRGKQWYLDTLVIDGLLNFGNQNMGQRPVAKQISLHNRSYTNTSTVTSISITGAHADQFSISPGDGANACPSLTPTLNEGETCFLNVRFIPTSIGGKTAIINIAVNGKTLDIPVYGTEITTISGSLYDLSTGNPLAAATVALTGGTTTQTGPAGTFIFNTPPDSGVYTVTITKAGYGTATINNIIIADNAGANLNVGMAPSGTLNFTTASGPLYHAETSTAYNQSANITGGAGPYTFTKAYGNLPPGLTIDPALGTISGTPVTAGSFTFALGVTDQLGAYAEREFSIEVTAPLVITTQSTLPRALTNAGYSQGIVTTGGKAPLTFALTAGALPNGLTCSSSGNITGTPQGYNTCSQSRYKCCTYVNPDGSPSAGCGNWYYNSYPYKCNTHLVTECVGYSYVDVTGNYTFTAAVTDVSGRTASQGYTLAVDSPLSNTTIRLHDGIVGSVFNQTLTATGGLPPYTLGVYSGILPAGLTLDPGTGIITGTPTSATTQPVVISRQDSYGRVAYNQFTINVLNPLQVLTSALPNGLVSHSYSEAIRTSGGIGPYSFALTGQLPAGFALNTATGIISGTPTAPGLTNLQVTVTDSSYPIQQTKQQNLSIRVTSSVTITTGAVLSNAKKGNAITPITLTANGGVPGYTWSITGGAVPPGLTLDPASGIISGTPTDRGDFTFTVRVTDTIGNATGPFNAPPNPDKQFVMHISDTLAVTTGAVPNGAKGLSYSAVLTATGGLKNYRWAVKTGTLPAGLSLNAATGAIAGTPSANITSNVTFEVTDSDAPAQKATVALIFVISDTLSIYEGNIPNSRINHAYSANIRAQLGTPPYNWRVSAGTLPVGVNLTQNVGAVVLSGTPTAAGTSTFTLEVSDNSTPVQTVSRVFNTIVYPDVVIATAGLKTAVRGTPYSDTVTATGGLLPYTYTITAGTLPTGLAFNSSTGAINGSVTMATGTSATFTVTVTDSGYPSASVNEEFTIMAIDPLVIATSVIPGALQKSSYSAALDGSGGVAPLSWSVGAGNLPQGISINANSGAISGTSVSCGTFNFTVQLADNATVPTTVQKAMQLAVTCSNDYDLRGSIGVANATVTLSGTSAKSTTSDASGNYLFQHLTNGSYSVAPTKTGYWFNTDIKSVIINNLDMAGVNFIFHADSTAPTGSITINNGAAATNSLAVTLALSATDSGSEVVTQMQISDDGSTWTPPETFAQSKNWTMTAGDGERTIAVKFMDKAGNWSNAISKTIILDTVPPETTIAGKPVTLSNTPSPSFTLASTDLTSTFECRIDGAAFASCTSPKTFSGLTAGSHTFEVRATDLVGNTDATPASYAWSIDLTSPDTTMVTRPASHTKSTEASFTFTSDDSNATFECQMDGGTFAACASPNAYTVLSEGSHTYAVRAVDQAGNSDATPAAFTWTVDLTPPDTGISSKPDALTASASASFIFTATETGATFECHLDGFAFAACTTPRTFSSLTLGTHTFEVRAVDAAGNRDATPASHTWERGVSLDINFDGKGNGTVTGIPTGISCTGPYTAVLVPNIPIKLIATSDINSYFSSWAGDCSGNGDCSLALNVDASVTATFSTHPPLKKFGSSAVYYSTFVDAYAGASSGSAVNIQARVAELQENVKLDRNVNFTLLGGYDGAYSGVYGYTTLNGTLTISRGSLRVDKLIVK